ncbi:MAG TPA: glycosyltransferase, partial [Steroidobacter sp.]
MTDLASRMSSTISVLLPTFNRAQLVQEAIESILKQRTTARFEIIVINDGSSDDTEEALQRYRGVIRYVRQENAGLNAARNHGLELATGEYIALLDDDDVWLPFKTALELAALERFPGAAFVHSNFFIWKPHENARRPDGLRTWYPRPFACEEMYGQSAELELDPAIAEAVQAEHLKIWCGDTYYWALFAPMVLPSAAIIRRSAIADLRFPESDSTCGDWDFFAQLSHRAGGVFVPIETTLNRSHEDRWRLTRIDGAVQMRRRVAFIRRRWRSDEEFMREHAREV